MRSTEGPGAARRRHPWSAFVLVAAALVLTACAPDPPSPKALGPSTAAPSAPRVLVYRGPAGCDGCSEAAAAWIAEALPGARTQYVGPDESRPVDASTLTGATLYVQPGGDLSVDAASDALAPAEERAIATYVREGGRYLGICQGAYLAGHDPGMGLLGEADTGQYIDLPGALVRTDADALVPVLVGGRRVQAYVQDGPFVTPGVGTTVVARYADGPVDAATTTYGRGTVGVVGTHPEAPLRWYREAGLDPSGRAGNASVGTALLRAMGLQADMP